MFPLAAVIGAATIAGVAAERRFVGRAEPLARVLLSLLLWGFLPVIAFFNIAALELTVRIGAGIGFAYVAQAATLLVAFLVGTHLLRLARPTVGALMLGASHANTGPLGLPFVAALFGLGELPNAVAFDVLVSVVWLVTIGFAIGAAFGTAADTPRERVFVYFAKNPVLVASVLGFLAPDVLAPDWAVRGSQLLVFASIPMAFFAIGVILASEAGSGERLPSPLRNPALAWAIGLKLALPPAIMVALSYAVIEVPPSYIVLSAMGCGMSHVTVAATYGLDRGLAAAATAYTTALVLVVGVVIALL